MHCCLVWGAFFFYFLFLFFLSFFFFIAVMLFGSFFYCCCFSVLTLLFFFSLFFLTFCFFCSIPRCGWDPEEWVNLIYDVILPALVGTSVNMVEFDVSAMLGVSHQTLGWVCFEDRAGFARVVQCAVALFQSRAWRAFVQSMNNQGHQGFQWIVTLKQSPAFNR